MAHGTGDTPSSEPKGAPASPAPACVLPPHRRRTEKCMSMKTFSSSQSAMMVTMLVMQNTSTSSRGQSPTPPTSLSVLGPSMAAPNPSGAVCTSCDQGRHPHPTCSAHTRRAQGAAGAAGAGAPAVPPSPPPPHQAPLRGLAARRDDAQQRPLRLVVRVAVVDTHAIAQAALHHAAVRVGRRERVLHHTRSGEEGHVSCAMMTRHQPSPCTGSHASG